MTEVPLFADSKRNDEEEKIEENFDPLMGELLETPEDQKEEPMLLYQASDS